MKTGTVPDRFASTLRKFSSNNRFTRIDVAGGSGVRRRVALLPAARLHSRSAASTVEVRVEKSSGADRVADDVGTSLLSPLTLTEWRHLGVPTRRFQAIEQYRICVFMENH